MGYEVADKQLKKMKNKMKILGKKHKFKYKEKTSNFLYLVSQKNPVIKVRAKLIEGFNPDYYDTFETLSYYEIAVFFKKKPLIFVTEDIKTEFHDELEKAFDIQHRLEDLLKE